jgi:hypothetical protein
MEELRNMKSLADVLEWVGLEDDLFRKAKSGLWKAIGAPKMVRHLASIPWATWSDAISTMKVDVHTGAADGPLVSSGPPTAVEMGQVVSVRRISRILMGVDPLEVAASSGPPAPALPDAAASAAPTPVSSLVERKIKLSSVMDQGDDTEVRPMDPATVRRLIGEWRQFENDGEDPREDEEATGDQLASLDFRLKQGSTPFVDFGVWRPYGARLGRMLKFSAYYPLASGGFQSKEINGPGTFDEWLRSWRVFSFAMVVLKAATRSKLEKYELRIARLNEQYPAYWWVIALADIRMRSEHLERVRRKIVRDTAANNVAPGTCAFNEAMPWDSAFREAARDDSFWYENVDKKAIMFATQLRTSKQINDEGIGSVVELGSSSSAKQPTAKRGRSPVSVSPQRSNRNARTSRDAKKKKGRKTERPTAPRVDPKQPGDKGARKPSDNMMKGKDDGRHFLDSSGSPLCWAWNHKSNGCGNPCSMGRKHACEWCLSTNHRSIACNKKPAGWVP